MKQTEIGLIPDDWEVKEFNQVATLINGRAYSQSELLKQGKYKVLRVGNFGTNDTWYYSNLELPEKQYCNKGDLLYCWSCTYGAYIWNEDDTIYHYHIWKIQPNNADKYYLKYILNNDIASQMSNSNGSTMAHITKGFLEKRRFVFPPFEEQQRIAKALSDVDALIFTTEKLLQKKKNIKQGTMQNLLTGKKRLPGFAPVVVEPVETTGYKQTELGLIPEDWEVKALGDFCSIKDGTHGTYNRVENGYYLLSAKNILNGQLDIQDDESMVSESDYLSITANGFPKKGDLLISCVGTIGRCCLFDSDDKIAFQRSVAFIRQNHIDNIYVMYFIQSNLFQNQLRESVNASTLGGVYLGAFNPLIIIYPSSKEEQTAIANVLSSMDKEIETLNTKLEKYRNLKTAMMQQLLTGKIRLK